MGGTPVVVQNPSMDNLFAQLPVIVLENWGQLSSTQLMEQRWEQARIKPWNKRVLSMSFWKEKLLETGAA